MIYVAIGDIHGMLPELHNLLGKIDEYFNTNVYQFQPEYQLVFIGDYIDRGKDSYGVIQLVQSLQKTNNAIALRGNHEQMMLDAFTSGYWNQVWLSNGGTEAIDSIGGADTLREVRDWANTLPTFYETKNHYFVHAGIHPSLTLEEQTDEQRLWIRERFLHERGRFPKYVVHGHTPTIAYMPQADLKAKPDVRDNRCNVDTGAVFGGTLSAAFFDDENVYDPCLPFHTISVPSYSQD